MKILVVSDTHRDTAVLRKIISDNPDADMLIHLGDGESDIEAAGKLYPELPIVYVAGNCDYGDHEKSHIVMLPGLKIFCCHGHRYMVNLNLHFLAAEAKKNDCVLALYGHTHVRHCDTIGGVMLLNPGSPSSPRDGKAGYAVITVSPNGGFDTDFVDIQNESAGV